MKNGLRLLALLLLSLAVWAQADANKGQIVGTVMDPNQAVIPNAKVTVKNVDTGLTRELNSNEAGQFRAVLLDPGQYQITVSSPGFAGSTLKGVTVNVGSAVDVPVVLQLGTTTQTVEVVASPINTELAAPSEVVNNLAIRDLPINGSRFQDFALLTPTVQLDPGRQQLSFVGQRGVNANVMMDGTDYNQPFFGGIRGGERSNFVPTVPQDAIQEFQVVTDGYAAEYGRSTGGVLNVITKSGTNILHGDAFYNLRHKELGLKTPFNKQILETLQVFGGSAGGAIKADKLFWFGAIQRQLSTTPRQVLFGAISGVQPNANNSEALAFYHSLEGPFRNTNDATALTTRVDYQLSKGSRIALRYNFSDATAENAASVGDAATTLTTSALSANGAEKDRAHTGVAQLTSIITPNIANDVRFNTTLELRPRVSNSALPGVTSTIGAFGAASFLPTTEDDKRIQIADSLSIIRGVHSFKVGADFSYITAFQQFGFNQFGFFRFNTSDVNQILDILSVGGSIPNRFDTPLVTYQHQIGNLLASVSEKQIAFYGEDSWRVAPRLTLDFGVRWEGQINPKPEANNTAVIQTIQAEKFPLGVTLDPTKIPNALNQWMPRFGFNLKPFNNDRTVIRGHAGIFYASTPLLLLTGPENNFRLPPGDVSILLPTQGSTIYKDLLSVGIDLNKFPLDKLPVIDIPTVQKAAAGTGTLNPFRGASFTGFANDFKNPRAVQAGLGLEQQLFSRLVAGIQFNYVNTVHLERSRDYNVPPPTVRDASGRPIFGITGAGAVPRPLPQYSSITVRESSARQMYRGMTISTRYKSGRLQFGAFYTLSQNYSDDDSERDAGTRFYENAYNLRQEYGFSRLDARHQFTSNAIAFLPWGFELSGIYRFRSGSPIDPLVGSDVNLDQNNQDRAYQAPGVPFKRNSFRNYAFNDVDMRFLKSFNIRGERAKLQFSTELFNLFNFTNVIIAGRNLNYGAGVNAQGQSVPALSTFRQLRLANGTYDPVNTQVGFPFQAQFGLRLLF